MAAKFTIYQSATNNQYYYRLRSGNGEIILSGEGYTTRQSCINGVNYVKQNAPFDERYERKDGSINFTFNLKGGNGEIIESENYTTHAGRENEIAAVFSQLQY